MAAPEVLCESMTVNTFALLARVPWAGLAACLLMAPLASLVYAGQVRPIPVNPADPGVTVGPPVVIESQPSIGAPVSAAAGDRVWVDVRSGLVARTVVAGGTLSMPFERGEIEVTMRFPGRVDLLASSVTVQQAAGDGSWQAQPRDPPAPEAIAFVLRGASPADLIVQVQASADAAVVQFELQVTPMLVVTPADAGQTITLHKGERFVFEPGAGYLWSVIVADPAIVAPVDDGSAYEALQQGTTSLLLSGDPACSRARTRCLVPSLSAEVLLVVV
jgi:hypothetical protein